MDKKLSYVVINGEADFNSIVFEKKLTALKDSQDSINACCKWCLENRHHHKKIVGCWLNVLKRVKIEQRLTLFYLANDVIQYSKRRNYDFVESWSTTLQRATTLVREEKVKHKILRIFKIWEQRGVYGDDFISDLCGLISVSPTPKKTDEPHEFQASYLIQKIRTCSSLEGDTDSRLRKLKNHNPKIQNDGGESLVSSLKDRAHVDDVEKELEDYTKHMESYVNALNTEIKARLQLISLLTQAQTQLEKDRRDVKLVTNAYKTFGSRVKTVKKKLDEKMPTITSPIPSPDVNAPSPSPDSDMELLTTTAASRSPTASAGYYNPVPPPKNDNNESTDFSVNFTSFLGTNMGFDLQNLSSVFNNNSPSVTTAAPVQTQATAFSIDSAISSLFPVASRQSGNSAAGTTPSNYNDSARRPLLPPPMPPFNKNEDGYAGNGFNEGYNGNTNSNYGTLYDSTANNTHHSLTQAPPNNFAAPASQSSYPNTFNQSFTNPPQFNTPPESYSYRKDEYNPEEELETWEQDGNWDQPPADIETPESPPTFEQEAYTNPVEYHDRTLTFGTADVDQRLLSDVKGRGKDVDHRNLISLTGSPRNSPSPLPWSGKQDQDYRSLQRQQPKTNTDKDYRVPFAMDKFSVPPPPPPPPTMHKKLPGFKLDNDVNVQLDPSKDDPAAGLGAGGGKIRPIFPAFSNESDMEFAQNEVYPIPPRSKWEDDDNQAEWEEKPFRDRGGNKRSFDSRRRDRPWPSRSRGFRGRRGGPRFRSPFKSGFDY